MWMRILVILTSILFFGIIFVEFVFVKSEGKFSDDHTTAKQILTNDENADIFQYHDLVYIKIQDTSSTTDLQKGNRIGQIIKQTNDHEQFTNGTANKLPIGTSIYQVVGKGLHMLIVELNGENIFYRTILNE